jgi:hypothetical protein
MVAHFDHGRGHRVLADAVPEWDLVRRQLLPLAHSRSLVGLRSGRALLDMYQRQEDVQDLEDTAVVEVRHNQGPLDFVDLAD